MYCLNNALDGVLLHKGTVRDYSFEKTVSANLYRLFFSPMFHGTKEMGHFPLRLLRRWRELMKRSKGMPIFEGLPCNFQNGMTAFCRLCGSSK